MRSGVAGAGGLRDRGLAWPWTESGSGCAYPRGGVGSGLGPRGPRCVGCPQPLNPPAARGSRTQRERDPEPQKPFPARPGGPRAQPPSPVPQFPLPEAPRAETQNLGELRVRPQPPPHPLVLHPRARMGTAPLERVPQEQRVEGGPPGWGCPQLGPPSARPWTRLCRCPIAEALRSLSFLGLRAPPCTPLWGRELLRGRSGGVLLPVTLPTQLSPCPGLSPCLWPPHIPSLHPITALLAGVGTLVAQSASLLGDTSHCGPPLTLPCSPQDPPRGSVGPGSPRGCTSARTWWDAVCSSTHCWTTRRALW